MKDSQILSGFTELAPAPAGGASQPPPALAGHAPEAASAVRVRVFDACAVGVVLRTVLYVQGVVLVGALLATGPLLESLLQAAIVTCGALPATLVWLVVCCSLKRPLDRLPRPVQYAAGVALGAAAGVGAAAMMVFLDFVARLPWLGSALAGALLAGTVVAGLVWRARARAPAAVAARLAELQSRIRPHFLFNTLNTAIALVREEPAKAEAMLEDLSDLFRHALRDAGDACTLAEELALAQRYLAIEQMRFGQRLQVQWSLDERASGAQLPPLLLQPLVENAVKHGVEPSPGGAWVRICTRKCGSSVMIEVTNTVPAGQGAQGHGLALANVRDRLALLHDLRGSLHTALADGVFQARLEVPMPEGR